MDIYGLRDESGSMLNIQLDDDGTRAVNTSSGTGGAIQEPSLLSSFSDLNSSAMHTLTLSWSTSDASGEDNALSYMYFSHLMIQDFSVDGTSSSKGSQGTVAPTSASDIQAPANGLKGVDIAAIAVGILLFISMASAMLYYLFRGRFRSVSYPWRSKEIKDVTSSFRKEYGSEESRGDSRLEQDTSARPLELPPYEEKCNTHLPTGDVKEEKSERRSSLHLSSDVVSSELAVASRSSSESKPSSPQTSPQRSRGSHEHLSFDPSSTTSLEKEKRLTYFSVRKAKRVKIEVRGRLIRNDTLGDFLRKPAPAPIHSSKRDLRPLPSLPSPPKHLPRPEESRTGMHHEQYMYPAGKRPISNSDPSSSGTDTLTESPLMALSFDSYTMAGSVRSVLPPYLPYTYDQTPFYE